MTTMLDVCRICLRTGGRMFTMNKYKLRDTFEHITGISLQEDNALPQMLCTECAQKLSNCGKLRAKSLQANAILTELAIQHGDLTLQIIESIDRNIHQLHSNLHTKLYEPDHCDYLIVHTDEQTDIKMADVEIKTESIDETYLDENDDEFIDEETLADQVAEDHISLSADCQKAADSNNKIESLLKTNEFRKRLVVMLERIEFKDKNDIELDIEDSVTKSDLVVKQEYPGEDTSIGRQGECSLLNTNEFGKRLVVMLERIEFKYKNDIGIDIDDSVSESDLVVKQDYPGEDASIGRQGECSGRPPVSNSMLDDDNEMRTATEVQTTEHVKDTAKETLRHLRDEDKTKSAKRPLVQLGELKGNFPNNTISVKDCINSIKDASFACDSCSYVTSLKHKLIKHLKSHENRQCKICLKKFAITGLLKVHLRVHADERHKICEICGKKFIKNSALILHKRVHTGEKPYSCKICGKKFTLSGNLYKHVRRHTGENPYNCELCGKKFTNLRNLKQHIIIHTGERLYSCEICGKKFTLSGNLNRHVRRHTGEKPYNCEICGKKCTELSNLKQHIIIHTGERPYSLYMQVI